MTLSTNPERDPWFRLVVIMTVVALLVMMGFDALYRDRPKAAANPSQTQAPMSMAPGGSGNSSMTPEQMAAIHRASMEAFPARTAGLGGQVRKPSIQRGVRIFRLMAMPIQWEVTPGQFVTAWAYNNQVPGPEIRVHRGDRIKVILTNHLPEPTVIHWHGVTVPNAMDGVPYVTQDPVMPGGSFTYEFTVVDSPGTYLYHSHFDSTTQVAQGLYGSFVIEPSNASWDVEYTEIVNDGALGYTINGKGWPATTPLVARLGQRVLVRLANVGQMLHPLPLHGYHFTVVDQDGFPLRRPYEADTLVVAPGETYDVVVKADHPGVWALHCHILSHVEGPEGMFGMATALIVQ
ncbi:MAG: copper oxidase [Actinobacteria bacterium]|nr:MAG: copper oxidase [Actinomycetota bacterium]